MREKPKKYKKAYSPKTMKKIEKLEREVWKPMEKKTRCLADELIRQEMAWERRDVQKAAKVVGMNVRTAYLKTRQPTFLEYLDKNTMDNSNLAKILWDKVKQHYALAPWEDKDLPKYLDMVLKVKGLYNTKLTIDVNKEPEAITFMKQIINGDNDAESPEETIDDTTTD